MTATIVTLALGDTMRAGGASASARPGNASGAPAQIIQLAGGRFSHSEQGRRKASCAAATARQTQGASGGQSTTQATVPTLAPRESGAPQNVHLFVQYTIVLGDEISHNFATRSRLICLNKGLKVNGDNK